MSAYAMDTTPASAATVTASSVAPTSSPVKLEWPSCRLRVRTRRRLPDGHASVTGELIGADDDAVTVAAEGGVVSIAYADIQRSNLVGD